MQLVRGKVYKSIWLNILNFSFFVNLILLCLVLSDLYDKDRFTYFGYKKSNSSFPTSNGKVVKYVWLHDANIEYLQGKHILLFLIESILTVLLQLYFVILVYSYTLFLLFIKPFQNTPCLLAPMGQQT